MKHAKMWTRVSHMGLVRVNDVINIIHNDVTCVRGGFVAAGRSTAKSQLKLKKHARLERGAAAHSGNGQMRRNLAITKAPWTKSSML